MARHGEWTFRWSGRRRQLHEHQPAERSDDFAYVTREGDPPCTTLLFRSARDVDQEGHFFEQHTHVLSVVGPYVSLCHNARWDGGAHGGMIWKFGTVDMRTGEALSLHDIFDDEDIYAAMIEHPRIARALDGKTPSTLAQLLYNLGGCLDVGNSVNTTPFALDSFADGRAKVRIWAHNDNIRCVDEPTRIDLQLPVPAALLPVFESAKRQRLLPLTDVEAHSRCTLDQSCGATEPTRAASAASPK